MSFARRPRADNGGGLYFWAQGDSVPTNQESYKEYRHWTSNISAVVVNNTIRHNRAMASGSSGGGVAIENGFVVTMIDNIIEDNTASLYGGGIYMDATPNYLYFDGVNKITGNHVFFGTGEQLASFSGGDISWEGLQVNLSAGASQILVQAGGNITNSEDTLFTCPTGYLFRDLYGDLFGSSAALMSQPGWDFPVLVSTLLFQCEACPPGFYTLQHGYSNGGPGDITNPPCLPCPYGGVCTSGKTVVASAGFWGAIVQHPDITFPNGTVQTKAYSAVEFMQCPDGYCCTGDDTESPCTSINSCANQRSGRLCGECPPGYGEVMGSSSCRRIDDCKDGYYVWPVVASGLLVVGAVMLRNSGIWVSPNKKYRASGLVKFTSYFYQVRCVCAVGLSSPKMLGTLLGFYFLAESPSLSLFMDVVGCADSLQ